MAFEIPEKYADALALCDDVAKDRPGTGAILRRTILELLQKQKPESDYTLVAGGRYRVAAYDQAHCVLDRGETPHRPPSNPSK